MPAIVDLIITRHLRLAVAAGCRSSAGPLAAPVPSSARLRLPGHIMLQVCCTDQPSHHTRICKSFVSSAPCLVSPFSGLFVRSLKRVLCLLMISQAES